MHFHSCDQNRRQKIGTILIAVWLCGWIGMALLHDLSHAAHAEENHTSCAVCRVLPQSAPAAINAELAVRVVPDFECIAETAAEPTPFRSQISLASAVPRGPPRLLLI